MTEREKFEAWAKSLSYARNLRRYHDEDATWPGHYYEYAIQLAWEAWQAARGQWLPIESAPEQGTFLVYMPTEQKQPIQAASWHPAVKVIGNHFIFDMEPATHFMPLPAPPQTTEKD